MRHLSPVVALTAAFIAAGFLSVGASPRTDGTAAAQPRALEQDTTGEAIFKGKGMCHVCHGADAKGTPLAPDLTDDEWLNIDGSVEGIVEIVTNGVPEPKEHPAPMPPLGGADLSEAEVQSVAEYVKSLSGGEGG